ncbi:MAG: 1-deoxy-D-xylulose-5-phosphate reductoisomerase [Gammaproteobacteria bacterium]|nr:1-deoxy-D-xylulose-5-phosphate reductoisomerase [Gammaproteobacteria bacterium]MXW10919.1 1-deoxy-D-xylulose-5-phosphate reductoisomerase [Gammaproteobacteria bacterium]MYC52270.1 1-deoxy-D-xylulose-5-phosphate reductoisomerase [Gammaproteobacteria bacterium]
MIRIAILGSTGSVGRSALEVVGRHPGRFRVVALAANRSVAVLREQAALHRPRRVVVADPGAERLDLPGVSCAYGREALIELAGSSDADVVVNALVGVSGLEPTLAVLRAGKRLALANKESLVAGGELVDETARSGGGELVPVDSEHSAILQCLAGSDPGHVARIVLTASGGPFRRWDASRMNDVTPADALRHPTWNMGSKITIDSATLANKALEVIEAHFLYGMEYERIDVVVHPQSIVHSFVEFTDGSVVAQLGLPTMELPILYALTHPERIDDARLRTFRPSRLSDLTFEELDRPRFPLFELGVQAGRAGGWAPTVFNAANEVAVHAFLEGVLPFREMAAVVGAALERTPPGRIRSVEDVLGVDAEARRVTRESIDAVVA